MTHQDIAALLLQQDNILILTHKRPDGDTIGCAAGLCAALRQAGKTAWVLHNPDATTLFTPYLEGMVAPQDFAPDYVVAVDIAGVGLLPDNAKAYLEPGIHLGIDHHPSNEGFAQINFVVPEAAACGELIYHIAKAMGPVGPEIATPLYVAVSTDTGCFVYGNTKPATLRVAADLMDIGVPYSVLNKKHFRTKSFKRLQLEAMMLEAMELAHDGMVAVSGLSLEAMASIDAHEEDAEDIAAFLGQIEGVKVSATIRELQPGECKISLRTDPRLLNATATCARLGGGGHMAASGATVEGSLADAKRAILTAIYEEMASR